MNYTTSLCFNSIKKDLTEAFINDCFINKLNQLFKATTDYKISKCLRRLGLDESESAKIRCLIAYLKNALSIMNSSLYHSLDITTNYSVEVCAKYRPDLTTFISVDYRYEIVDLFEEFYKCHHPSDVYEEDEIVSTVISIKYETYKFIVKKELIKICEPINRKLALDVAENYDFSIPKNVEPMINRGNLPAGFVW